MGPVHLFSSSVGSRRRRGALWRWSLLLGAGWVAAGASPAAGASGPSGRAEALPPRVGLAAKYPGDVGIAADPAVLFTEDFEAGDWRRWDDRRGEPRIVTEQPAAGRRCARLDMRRGSDTGCDAKKWFLPGADCVYVRCYVRFSPDYRYPHHFVTLLANRADNRWSAFGQAGKKPDGRYFSTGMEPHFAWGRNPPPGELTLYSYHLDLPIDPKMNRYFGQSYHPPGPGPGSEAGRARVVPALDRWQCWEFMVEANSAPGRADGRQAMWLDGRLIGEFTGIRWRSDPALKVNCLWLQHYGYDPSDPTRNYWGESQTVWFDDVVVARAYIGPRQPRS